MSKETKVDVVDEARTVSPAPADNNTLEMVFGTPNSPKNGKPDVHFITNETNHGENINSNNKTLLEPDKAHLKPPLAGPEEDDLDLPPALPSDPALGLPGDNHFEPIDGTHDINGNEDGAETEDDSKHLTSGDDAAEEGLDSRFGVDDRPGSPMITVVPPPDVNTYQQKKNLAQGMMDLALLSANANQLRYVIESASNHPYYYPSLTFIAISLVLQVAVGVGLILNSRYDVKDDKEMHKADRINNMTVLGIFLITIVNVFITSFSVGAPVTNN